MSVLRPKRAPRQSAANADYEVSDFFRLGNRIGVSRTDQSTIPTDYP